jgi:hypothetical protein
MIVDPRLEPQLVLEIDGKTAYSSYKVTVSVAGTFDDFYKFITTPSPQRERFIISLSRTVCKADEQSIIELLS